MSDRRVLTDITGALAPIVDGLHDVLGAFDGRKFAIVGGIAVLTHVQGHRVTQDIDSAVRGLKPDIRAELPVVAKPGRPGQEDALLPNGVPVDLLIAGVKPPRRGIGMRREAKGHAVRWAVETAMECEVACEPENSRGPVVVPVARVSALLAMKTIAIADPRRRVKAADDRLDLWRLLAEDPDRSTGALEEIRLAPPAVRTWTARMLKRLLCDDPERFLHEASEGLGAPREVADVIEVWETVVEPHVPAMGE